MPVTTLNNGATLAVPSHLRIVPAFNVEADRERWNVVEQLLAKDFASHHVEVLNRHTKEYQPNYAVHALLGFYKINASETVMKERYDLESKMLDPAGPVTVKITADNWTEYLGKGQTHYTAYTQFFLTELETKGIKPTIATYLPTLVRGLGNDCFHPLVHLGLGLEFQHPFVIAQGLSYWAYTYTPIIDSLPPTVDDDDTANVMEILQDAREDVRFDPEQIHPHWGQLEFHKRVRKAVGSKLGQDLAELVSEWKIEENEHSIRAALEELTNAVVLAAVTTGHVFPQQLDFPLMQGLIACKYLHTTLAFLPTQKDQIHLLRRFLLVLLAVYVSQGRPNLHPDRLETAYFDSMDTEPLSTSPPVGSPTLPTTPVLMAREWHALCGAPAHLDDDVHVMDACAALKMFEDLYGEKSGAYLKAAKVVRSVVKTGSGEEWEFRGCGYPQASSFLLEEEE
ncbi:hypothetical protein SpCBS45565_g08048 [Spizellomyces sp. 'palustris']|nr:hypothetical protein SpCBS45565_g08048 [Spizellomyces sp. 'palustris']